MLDILSPTPDCGDAVVHGRILIVDDDPLASAMLGSTLEEAGHAIIEAGSGEDALSMLAGLGGEKRPDIVFLDIEMGMGIDGYETCRRLRRTDAGRELPVIFLSGHDNLEARLQAYDAGGNDFIAKPFVPDEMLRKALVAIRHKRRQDEKVAENQATLETAKTALTSLGDYEVTLKFSRGALGCSTLHALATLMIRSMASFGLECQVQLRAPTETLTLTPQGPASPLEASVIDQMMAMDRMFSFGKRLVVNYDAVSLLVTNMPVGDEQLCGRIRDEAAVIAETAEQALVNINLRIDAALRADKLRALADESRVAIDRLRDGYQKLQVETRAELEGMAYIFEGIFVHLSLSDRQEFVISDTVRGAIDRVLKLMEVTSEFDQSFAAITDGLTKAGEYTVTQEDDPVQTIEVW